MSYLQHSLQFCAGGFFVLVEGVGIDVQRGGGLTVTEDARYRGHVRAACNHQAGGGVAQAVDIELLRQTVLFQNALESPREGGGRHGQACALSAEQEVCCSQFSFIVGLGDVLAFPLIFTQERFHLGGEVDVPVTGTGLGFLDEYLVAGDFYGIAADVDGTLFPVDVPPLQSAALAPPHSRGDDELEVGFVLDALALQRGDDLLCRFLVRNLLLTFAAKYPQCCRQTDDDEQGGLTFEIEKGRLSFRLTAPYSEERRRAASEAAKKCGVHRCAF